MNSGFWDDLGRLWGVATGGTDVAARPNSVPSGLPNAPSVPGLDEASEWFRDHLHEPTNNYLFLVGGPGAGKSHVTSNVVREMTLENDVDSRLAHRKYVYSALGRRVTLINDATIPGEHASAALSREIDESIGQSHFLACVNRGILVEEKRDAQFLSSASIGKQIIRWLLNEEIDEKSEVEIEGDDPQPYFKSGRLSINGNPIGNIVAVYVDVCSLFERRPSVSHSIDGHWIAEPYEIASKFARNDWDDDATIAGSLLVKVLEFLGRPPSAPSDSWNPLLANLDDFSSESFRRVWLTTLRGAEIASGQKFTYRELWGAVVRSLVGDLPAVVSRDKVQEYLSELCDAILLNPNASVNQVRVLAGIRVHQSLFEVVEAFGTGGAANPVTDKTSLVDPMRDAIPGFGADKPGEGWFSPVSGALSGIADGESPLPLLRQSSTKHGSMLEPGQPFDEYVEEWTMKQIQAPPSKRATRDTARLQSSYASYLGRLYALHLGVRGFAKVTDIWMEACQLAPDIPEGLRWGLDTLIRPRRNSRDKNSSTLIPVLDSRTAPIVGTMDGSKFATELSSFQMSTERQGESLELLLKEAEVIQARVVLDFALVREALAAGEGEPGITEFSESTVPRLERFRASKLVPDLVKGTLYRLARRHDQIQISIQGGR